MDGPLVTVVTVCFNAEAHIAEAIESVLGQTYPNVEYLIVDGGSRDRTLEIVQSYEQHFSGRLTWTSEPDGGIYDAMNKGIAQSRGALIGLLNADDAYLPDTVELAVRAHVADPTAGAVYGDVEIVDGLGNVVRTERARTLLAGDTRPDRMPMCHQSLFVTRDLYEQIGVYEASYRVLADYEWILRALSHGVAMTHVPAVFSRFRAGGACSTHVKRSVAERELIRVRYGANPARERARRLTSDFIRTCSPITRRVRAMARVLATWMPRGTPQPSPDPSGRLLQHADEPARL